MESSASGTSRSSALVVREVNQANAVDSSIQDFNNTVAVLVGPEEQRFLLHQDAVCDKSKFFKAACSKRWIEGQEKLVRLPEAKAKIFQEYCKWIYSGVIPASRCTPEDEAAANIAELDLFVELYLLGDSLDDVQLRNLATQRFCNCLEGTNKLPPPLTYVKIWSSTPSGSLFRKQLVDIVVARYERDTMAKTIAQYPSEFIQEFAIAAFFKAPLTTWEAAIGDNTKYLEPEEAKDKTT
jgi:hypothetical protein